MVKVIQADREAAEYFARNWNGNLGKDFPDKIRAGKRDHFLYVRAFAKHREQAAAEERAKIAAYLRETAAILKAGEQSARARNHADSCILAAAAIEAGERLVDRPATSTPVDDRERPIQ